MKYLIGPLAALLFAFVGFELHSATDWQLGREIFILRAIILILALYNLTWCADGVWQLMHGRTLPVSIYQSVVFFGCMAMVMRHSRSLLGTVSPRGDPWTFEAFLFELAMVIAAFVGNRLAIARKAHKLSHLYDHLDEAVAIRDLAEVAPDEAKEIAKKARQRTAEIAFERLRDV